MNYNELVSAITDIDSLEELNALKDTLLNDNQNDALNNQVAVRMLSSQEYNKYIINGTCNGAIALKNNNVWHYILTSYTDQGFGISVTYNGSQPSGIVATFTNYREMLANNSAGNNASVLAQLSYTLSASFGYFGYHNAKTFGTGAESYAKSYRSFYLTITPSSTVFNQDSSGGRYRVNMNLAYRPVFQYKDNIKSTNVYR